MPDSQCVEFSTDLHADHYENRFDFPIESDFVRESGCLTRVHGWLIAIDPETGEAAGYISCGREISFSKSPVTGDVFGRGDQTGKVVEACHDWDGRWVIQVVFESTVTVELLEHLGFDNWIDHRDVPENRLPSFLRRPVIQVL